VEVGDPFERVMESVVIYDRTCGTESFISGSFMPDMD
jgi:hypothetical protein